MDPASIDKMIFRKYWLDRRHRRSDLSDWVEVRVIYGRGYTEIVWVLDAERGIYPASPSDLKTEHELPKKERDGLAMVRRYSYMDCARAGK